VTVKLQPQYPLHNLHNGNDVNNDGFIVAYDALLIVNWINAYGPTPIQKIGADATKLYLDTVADNYIASSDVLAVINYLNSHQTQSLAASGDTAEGEATGSELKSLADDDAQGWIGDERPVGSQTPGTSAPIILLPVASRATSDSRSRANIAGPAPVEDLSLNAAAVDQCLELGGENSLADSLRLL
jgi:hypothetical protein